MQLGTAAASTTTVIPLTFLPQFLFFQAATAPSLVQININGDGIVFNLDATGCTSMNGIRQVGQVAGTYIFQLANGLVKSKVGTITFTNTVAGNVILYGFSPVGNLPLSALAYFVYTQQNVLASSGATFSRFAYMAFPNAGTNDSFIINYNDGGSDNVSRLELNCNLFYTQDRLATTYNIDNINPARISSVIFVPVAAQSVYQMNYQKVNAGSANPSLLGR